MPGLGAKVITINVDPQIFVDETQGTLRGYFDNVMHYILSTYPGVQVDINSGFTADNLAVAQDSSATCGCPGFGQTCGSVTVNYQDPRNLASCVGAPYTWLPTGSGTHYSPYGYIAHTYSSGSFPSTFIRRFVVMHEPTSVNKNYGCTPNQPSNTTCGTTNWTTAIGTMITQVASNDPSAKVCVAFDSAESGWQGSMITSSPAPTCVGYDSFTDNILASGDLGSIDTMINSAHAAGKEVFVNALGPAAWVPLGAAQTDGQAFWGIGNCGWLGTDFFRQSSVINSLYFAYKGATEISYLSLVLPATWCAFTTSPTTGGADRTVSPTYAAAVATNVTHRTPLFWVVGQFKLTHYPILGRLRHLRMAFRAGGRRPNRRRGRPESDLTNHIHQIREHPVRRLLHPRPNRQRPDRTHQIRMQQQQIRSPLDRRQHIGLLQHLRPHP